MGPLFGGAGFQRPATGQYRLGLGDVLPRVRHLVGTKRVGEAMSSSIKPVRISLVTPSFNQARFLEPCLRSILDQGYPDLEYMVMDGGSTDGSVEVIRRYAPRLHSWRSHLDEGQYAAVAEGLDAATGEVMGWLNSDDLQLPWTLRTVGEVFSQLPEVEWLTSRVPLLVSESDALVAAKRLEGFNARAFFRGRNLPAVRGFYTCFIQQEFDFLAPLPLGTLRRVRDRTRPGWRFRSVGALLEARDAARGGSPAGVLPAAIRSEDRAPNDGLHGRSGAGSSPREDASAFVGGDPCAARAAAIAAGPSAPAAGGDRLHRPHHRERRPRRACTALASDG